MPRRVRANPMHQVLGPETSHIETEDGEKHVLQTLPTLDGLQQVHKSTRRAPLRRAMNTGDDGNEV